MMRGASIETAELITHFESLGDDCEFGTIQRLCGVEPLGLFRFNASTIDHMIDVVETCLAEFYTDADLELFLYDGLDEYMVKSRAYNDFIFHTQISPSEIARNALAAKMRGRMRFLKSKFEEDLASGEKIFVRKGEESLEKVMSLHQALKQFGPNTLLWMVRGTEAHPSGTMEVIADGLYRGHIANFKQFDTNEPADLAGWVDVCQQAYRRHRLDRAARRGTSRGHQARVAFVPVTRITSGNAWMFGPACDVQVRARPAVRAPLETVRSLTLKRDTRHEEALAYVEMKRGIRSGSIVAFSVWVGAAETFAGSMIEAWFLNVTPLHGHGFNISSRDRWQRIWVTAKVPPGVTSVIAVVRTTAPTGSVIELGSWRLDAGTVPAKRDERARGSSPRRLFTLPGLTGFGARALAGRSDEPTQS